eukprot:12237-Heterococcus_DN1.PRE.5
MQALVLLTTPAKRGGWCCDRLVSWGFKTLQGVAQTSYLRGKSNSNPKIKPVGSGSDDASATATAEQHVCDHALWQRCTERELQQHCIREISPSTDKELLDKKRHALAPKTAAKKAGELYCGA